jgi:hypothetical protein
MKRSIGVTLAAVVSLLGAALGLLSTALMVFGAVLVAHDPKQQVPGFWFGMFMAISVFGVPSVWALLNGIGLLRLREWARISTLIFGGLLVVFCGLPALLLAFIPFPVPVNAPSNLNPQVLTAIRLSICAVYGCLAAIGVWWLVMFNRASIRAQFATPLSTQELSASRRPLSISVIAWVMIVGAAFMPLSLWTHTPGMLFGYVFTGLPAEVYYVLFGLVQIVVGIGLLRSDELARRIALGYLAFGALNGLVDVLSPRALDRMQRIVVVSQQARYGTPVPQFHFAHGVYVGTFIVSVLFFGLAAYFLVARRSAFVQLGEAA